MDSSITMVLLERWLALAVKARASQWLSGGMLG